MAGRSGTLEPSIEDTAMKANQLVSLVIVLVVVALLAILFRSVREGQIRKVGMGSSKTKVLPNFPVNEVGAIGVRTADDELDLVREEGTWGVRQRDGYPADFEQVGQLLRDIYDLGIVERVPVGPSKFGRVGLIPPDSEEGDAEKKATVLSFEDEHDQEIAALWLGKEYKLEEQSQFGTMDQTAGRYVKRPDGENVFLVSEGFTEVTTDPADWLSPDFFQVRKVKSIERIPADDPEQGWKLVRESETGDFALVDPKKDEELDKTKVSPMKNAFSSPSFEDVIVGEDVEKPSAVTFKVETFEGFRYVVKVSEKNEANEYLLTVNVSADLPKKREPEEGESEEAKKEKDEEFKEKRKELKEKLQQEKKLEGYVYRVRGYVADSINKARSEILAEEEEEGAAGEQPATGAPAVPGTGARRPIPTPGAPPVPDPGSN